MGNGDDYEKIRAAYVKKISVDKSTEMFSRDLLQSFLRNKEEHEKVKEEGEEIELNPGLSLGEKFVVDKSSNKLWRSSSVASSLPSARDDKSASESPEVRARVELIRTSSFPVYSEFERLKRRELYTLRKMEAKRRRSGKQRNLKGAEQGDGLKEKLVRENFLGMKFLAGKEFESSGILEGGINVKMTKGKTNYAEGSCGAMVLQGLSEGSSYTSSDLKSRILEVQSGELSPASILPVQESSKQDIGTSKMKPGENMDKTTGLLIQNQVRPNPSRTRGGEIGNRIDDMPSVFTRGDGPNGKRVDGILYRYSEGEIGIMCVCHGNFHSPAEFVMHAGGTCVDNPLKCIVINHNSFSLF